MSEKKFTTQQQLALDINKHIVLTANAGSGKTNVLIHRYLQILLNDKFDKKQYDPQKILAITFTDQAAAEMLARITKEIDDKINSGDNTHNYKLIRRKLNQANISTIHSFCTKILREYPIDANLSSNFTALDEFQAYNIKKNSISEAINKYLEDEEVDEDARTLIFTNYSYKEIIIFVEEILSKTDILPEINKLYSNKEKFIELISEKIFEYFNPIIEDTKKYFKAYENISNKEKIENKDFLNLVQEILYDDFTENNSKNKLELKQLSNVITKIIKICKTKDGRFFLIPRVLKKYDEEAKYFLGNKELDAKQYRETLLKKIEINISKENILRQFDLSKEILKIANIAKNISDELKNKLGAIDFDDMLLRTRDLLKNSSIAQAVASNYTHILVDEFQDTNSIQYEIISSLAPMQNSTNINIPKLFIVGDDKQSIYRFRNADVSIFYKAGRDIKEYNKNNLIAFPKKHLLLSNNNKLEIPEEDFEDVLYGNLKLTATFRLAPVLAAFINKVCEKKFNKLNNKQIKYTPLICGKNSDEFINYFTLPKNNLDNNLEFGSIKMLLTVEEYKNKELELDLEQERDTSEDNENEDEKESFGEAERLAKYIKYLLDSNKFQANEIAILYRSRGNLSLLQTEFLKLKIPYSVISGGGFFQQQEVYDLTNYLKFLYNNSDDLALLGILRSPFFNFTDAVLYEIIKQKEKTLFNKLISLENISPTISIVVKKLKKLSEFVHIVSLPHLLRLILKSEDWHYWLFNQREQEKINQNIEKFISMARDFENRDFYSIGDFINEIESLQELSKEPEAAIETTENTVKFLTIHASKGKEFPVVALYSLNSGVKTLKVPLLNKNFGLSFNTFDTEASLAEEKTANIITLLSKNEEQQAENEELVRLLYVAATRAEKILILSATVKKKKDGKSSSLKPYFDFFIDGLSVDINSIINIIEEEKKYLNVDLQIKLLEFPSAEKTFNYKTQIEINPEVNLDSNKKIENTKEEIINPEIIISEKISNTENNRIFSFSLIKSFLNYEREEKKYSDDYLKRIIGLQNFELNSDNKSTFHNLSSNKNTINALEKGLIYHKIFENISIWFNENKINNIKLFETITSAINKQNIQLEKKHIDEIFEKCEYISKTKLFENFSRNIINSKREYSLTMPIGNNFITGNIDFLIQNNYDEWEVWDWKTNKIQNKNDLNRLKEEYELQMKIYCYFLMHLYPNQYKFTARLLLTELININSQDSDWTIKYEFTLANKSNIEEELINYIDKICTKISY